MFGSNFAFGIISKSLKKILKMKNLIYSLQFVTSASELYHETMLEFNKVTKILIIISIFNNLYECANIFAITSQKIILNIKYKL